MSVPPKERDLPSEVVDATNARLRALGVRGLDTGRRVSLENAVRDLEASVIAATAAGFHGPPGGFCGPASAPPKSLEELLGPPPRPAPRGYAIGVDQSANHTGVVVLSEGGDLLCAATIEPLEHGLWDRARLRYIRDQLELLCREHGPFKVGVWESYSMESKHRAFLLGEVGGIVQLALDTHAEQVFSAAPAALKKFATGHRLADKDTMKRFVQTTYAAAFEDDNLADAYALAQLGRALLAEAPKTRKQAEVRAAILASQGPAGGGATKAKKKKSFRINKEVL